MADGAEEIDGAASATAAAGGDVSGFGRDDDSPFGLEDASGIVGGEAGLSEASDSADARSPDGGGAAGESDDSSWMHSGGTGERLLEESGQSAPTAAAAAVAPKDGARHADDSGNDGSSGSGGDSSRSNGSGSGSGGSSSSSSASSPTLSLRLPSDDGTGLLLALAAAGATGGGGENSAAVAAALQATLAGGAGTGGAGDAIFAALLPDSRRGGGGGEKSFNMDAVAATLAQLQQELAHTERRRRMLEQDIEDERRRHETQLREAEQLWARQGASLRRGLELAESERDVAVRRLDDRRTFLVSDLPISDALAAELRRRAPEELSVREAVRLAAHNMMAAAKDGMERARRELQDVRETLAAATDAAEARAREHARAKRMADSREEGLRLEVAALEARSADLARRAEHAEAEAETLRDKGRRYDVVAAASVDATAQLEAARALTARQADALAALTDAERTLSQRTADAEQRRAALELDKGYLARQLDAAMAAGDAAERAASAAAERCRELERARDALAEELPRVAAEARESFERRLAGEVARLREANAKELDDVRGASREAWERENASLREARQSALEEARRLRAELAALRAAHDDLVLRLGRGEAAREAELAEARGELRLKSFELGQLGVAFEEKCGLARQAELREEMLQQQIEAHRAEFARLEATSEQKCRELQLMLDTEREKVRSFEELEVELDHAVVRAGEALLSDPTFTPDPAATNADGATAPLGTDGGSGYGGGYGGSYNGGGGNAGGGGGRDTFAAMDILDAVPTAPRRRVAQAIRLAHRLLQKEGEAEQ
ncbi:unnamed protein product, partial [Phaeothamnion confervicola]